MSIFIDRRLNPKEKNLVNRQRFIKKVNSQARQAIKDAINSKNIKDFNSDGTISIPIDDITETNFYTDQSSGTQDIISPGNKKFTVGDSIEKKKSGQGQGQGNNASQDGESEDYFKFKLTKEEFLELFFEDLELPNMIKKQLSKLVEHKNKRKGYTNIGPIANLDIVKSYGASLARRIALKKPKKEDLEKLLKLIEEEKDEEKKNALILQYEELLKKFKRISFFDDKDLRYRKFEKEPQPSNQAVMFCILDVSGSMDENKKDIAKRFFLLLYIFLQKYYKNVEIVFIRHHSEAEEVNENDFFYKQESGGTVVSKALELNLEIIKNRYPLNLWNIYIAQASDGDNFDEDNPRVEQYLNEILEYCQYFAYIQIAPVQTHMHFMAMRATFEKGLWQIYNKVGEKFKNLQAKALYDKSQIWAVFKSLFEKKKI